MTTTPDQPQAVEPAESQVAPDAPGQDGTATEAASPTTGTDGSVKIGRAHV